jgi:hypothetical protein
MDPEQHARFDARLDRTAAEAGRAQLTRVTWPPCRRASSAISALTSEMPISALSEMPMSRMYF